MRLCLTLAILLSGNVVQACSQDLEQQIRSEVLLIVEKINQSDATALADMYLREPTVGSLGDGRITKGWTDVADLLSLVFAQSSLIRMTVDSVTVTPLGEDAAVAYFRYYWDYETAQTPTTVGAMTLVFVRSGGEWKVAHDHTSSLPPKSAATLSYLGPQSPARSTFKCTVSRIVDGDTIECAEVGRVRLIGMDTPELSQEPYGSQATRVLTDLIAASSEIRLELDVERRDRYGRLLAYVWGDGRMLNWLLVRAGYAVPLTYPPNVQYVDSFAAAQQAARQERVGMWAVNGFACLPIDRRRGRCE
jgi:micrococcal nuclease